MQRWVPDITNLPGVWTVPWGLVDENENERDRVPERLPEMDRSDDADRRDDDPDDDAVAPDAKPLAGQEPG